MTEPTFTPDDLQRFVTASSITAQLIPMQGQTPTVAAAAALLAVSPGQIIKSLVFEIQDRLVLVIASGNANVQRRILADRLAVGKKQVKLAGAETVLENTGYPVGGVPPFGHRRPLQTLLDRGVLVWDVVYGGGGDDCTLLRVSPAELARATRAEWIDLGDP